MNEKHETVEAAYKKAHSLALEDKFAEAYPILLRNCENNHGPSLYAIGNWYYHGRHVRKNFKKAFEFLKRSELFGCKDGFCELAYLYETGRGTKKDLELAASYWLAAVKAGEKKAYAEVARTRAWGIGCAKDKKEARRYYHLSARWGDMESAYYLAIYYIDGNGGRRSIRSAILWLQRVAKSGSDFAEKARIELKEIGYEQHV